MGWALIGSRWTSDFDAVDGSSTGTSVPWMWALLRLPETDVVGLVGAISDLVDRSEVGFRGRQVAF
jgi:hypothetical protein